MTNSDIFIFNVSAKSKEQVIQPNFKVKGIELLAFSLNKNFLNIVAGNNFQMKTENFAFIDKKGELKQGSSLLKLAQEGAQEEKGKKAKK